MFVLKSGAGFSIFKWIAFLAKDFLEQALAASDIFILSGLLLKFSEGCCFLLRSRHCRHQALVLCQHGEFCFRLVWPPDY